MAFIGQFYVYLRIMSKIALVQHNTAWASPEANRRDILRLLEGTRGADVILLPEMFSTGFATEPQGIA